jgi:integrase
VLFWIDMNAIKPVLAAQILDVAPSDRPVRSEQSTAGRTGKSGKQVANQKPGGVGKNNAVYWQSRIFKPVNDRGVASPHYSMKVAFKGKRAAFGLGTANKEAASRRAASIYIDILSSGMEAALVKHRPQTDKPERVATVGEWIAAAQKVSDVNPATLNQYACSLRLIASGIAGVKKNNKRFGPKLGGAAGYRAMIDGISLEEISIPALQKWRLAYVAKATTPAERKSRMTSWNSTFRQARSLFSTEIVFHLKEKLLLPSPRPFEIPEELKSKKGNPLLYPTQNTSYLSKINPRELLVKAQKELESEDPSAFLVILFALGAGLRRGEIDGLRWNQVDLHKGKIRIEVTDSSSLKTQGSQGEVEIDEQLTKLLGRYKAVAKEGDFVIEGLSDNRGPMKWGQHYRADAVFEKVTAWLRENGVTAKKPLHELRKELGALITQEHGIYAASRALRHSKVATTAAHYVDKKERTTVAIGNWINPPKRDSVKK